MIKGARIQSSEGANYKTWAVLLDGTTKKVNKRSASTMFERPEAEKWFVFGNPFGIRLIGMDLTDEEAKTQIVNKLRKELN